MKFRFIEYQGDLYLVVGITYDNTKEYPDCFVITPIDKTTTKLTRTALIGNTLTIPIAYVKEITDKNKLLTLMVLYG